MSTLLSAKYNFMALDKFSEHPSLRIMAIPFQIPAYCNIISGWNNSTELLIITIAKRIQDNFSIICITSTCSIVIPRIKYVRNISNKFVMIASSTTITSITTTHSTPSITFAFCTYVKDSNGLWIMTIPFCDTAKGLVTNRVFCIAKIYRRAVIRLKEK